MPCGKLVSLRGWLAEAEGISPALGELVRVGEGLGEVVGMRGSRVLLQLFFDPEGLGPGERVEALGRPLEVWLGPHLLGKAFNGFLGPLSSLDLEKALQPPPGRWEFVASVSSGQEVKPGDVLGHLGDLPKLVPPGVRGKVEVSEGKVKADEVIAWVEGQEVVAFDRWKVREPRPVLRKLRPGKRLATGLRVLDSFIPLREGEVGIVAGGFGTGKTTIHRCLLSAVRKAFKIFVGCGERGNEMALQIQDFQGKKDTVLLANTSDMPVALREASVFTGLTVAEYFRDLGGKVLLLIDSLSRWAEALRERLGLLGEIPAEEGYPAKLGLRISEVFGRAGRVRTLGGKTGSITLLASVSPPSGDFSEPVTKEASAQASVGIFLSTSLARARFYPAVSLERSFSKAAEREITRTLRRAISLGQKVRRMAEVIGEDAITGERKFFLRFLESFEEGFLRQPFWEGPTSDRKRDLLLHLFYVVWRRRREDLLPQAPSWKQKSTTDLQNLLNSLEVRE